MALEGAGEITHATVHEPGSAPGTLVPHWVVLHGVTYSGEEHPALVRFARALAWSGGRVIIPEIPSWKRLELDPAAGQAAVAAALRYTLDRRDDHGARPPLGIVGFSFGCPQAVLAAAAPGARDDVDTVVGFGGYADLEATVAFGLTGCFRVGGQSQRLRPDPYGRWVVASNYLHRIPGLEDALDVASALRELAVLAGRRGIMSWDPSYDGAKDELARNLAPGRRGLFRLFAPPADREPDPREAADLAPRLAAAARDTHPSLDALHTIEGPRPPVHLFHGRHDQLIPWAETLEMARRLGPGSPVDVTITGLFGHSQERRKSVADAAEVGRFFLALRRALART